MVSQNEHLGKLKKVYEHNLKQIKQFKQNYENKIKDLKQLVINITKQNDLHIKKMKQEHKLQMKRNEKEHEDKMNDLIELKNKQIHLNNASLNLGLSFEEEYRKINNF